MTDFKQLITLAYSSVALRKLVFSKPLFSDAKKITASLRTHRGRILLRAEYALDDTVSQKNITQDELSDFLDTEMPKYGQINLITDVGEAEFKINKRGQTVILGRDKLTRRLCDMSRELPKSIDPLEREKKYILCGSEDFLIRLGVSDKNGRVHDKRQGKFRQINKFLEYIEEIYEHLPKEGMLRIYDLCCGKSYLSFAVYYYLTAIKQREVSLLGIDLKRDVIDFCSAMASECGFSGMSFVCDNIENTPRDIHPDMVISLHACDIATDIVLASAVRLGAKIILSTPCCHRHLSDMISCDSLEFVTKYPKLRGKLSEAITDALRLEYLAAYGYAVSATELTDPNDTPKNTLLRAILRGEYSEEKYRGYLNLLKFIIGEKYGEYLPF